MFRRTKARGSLLAGSLIAIAAVAAVFLGQVASSSAKSKAKANVTTISYYEYSADPGQEKTLATIVKAFEKANPTIRVNVVNEDYADYFTKLSTELAAGDAPDTFELDYQDFVNYAANGSLLNLAKAGGSYSKSAYTKTALGAFSFQNKQYALPEDFSDVLLFFNENLFRAAGVPLPNNTWTWADEMSAGKQLTNKSTGVWGLFQPVTFNEFYKALNQAGGQFFNAKKTKATFANAAGVAAANHLIGKLGTTMPTLAQIGNTPNFDTNLFTSGKLAMWINGNWQFSGLTNVPFKWNVIVEPGDVTKASAVFLDGVAINAHTAHKQAALAWLKYFTASTESVLARVKSNWELAPVAKTSLENSYLKATPPQNRKAVFQSLAKPSYAPVIPDENQMETIVNNALTSAADGSGSVQSELQQAQTQVDALLHK